MPKKKSLLCNRINIIYMRLHIITFLLLFAFTASLHAQNSLTISGRIVDKEKKAIEFASISLSNNATKKIVGTTASADGTFLLKAAKGKYRGH